MSSEPASSQSGYRSPAAFFIQLASFNNFIVAVFTPTTCPDGKGKEKDGMDGVVGVHGHDSTRMSGK